jgi:signal transduction histidine kinase
VSRLFARIRQLLTLGGLDIASNRLARQLRVTNLLALFGAVLSVTSVPIDAYGATPLAVVIDLIGGVGFLASLVLIARRHYSLARMVLLLAANATMLLGVTEVSGDPEVRSVCFPLALLPFLVFDLRERLWLALFVALPVVGYFLTGIHVVENPGAAAHIYRVYAPALAFLLLVTGCLVFVNVERNAEAAVLQARTRAAHAAQLVALGEMASGIAHEIRNPLAAIHLAASSIEAQPGRPEQVAQLGQRIQRIVMRASGIIETLRSLARDASSDPFVATPVQRIVGDTLELCGKRIAESGIALTIDDIPPALAVECRPVQLSQVLMNLMTNAYDAAVGTPDAWVRVEVTEADAHVEIAVSNSGPTIPEQLRQRIFEPFFTTKTADRGTGLGLSLSASLVEAHQGTLELDASKPHTRFVVRIPRAQPRSASVEV